jgi:SNF2 family DNA or RNA helicase
MQLTNFTNMPHQDATLARSRDAVGYGWFLETGLGKTKVALDNALYLWYERKIDGLLVVAPKGAYRTWTDIEIPKLMPDGNYTMAYWTAGASGEELRRINRLFTSGASFKIFVVNIEAFSTRYGWKMAEKFLIKFRVLWVIDESTSIKNPKALRTKRILELKDRAPYRRIMSGYPVIKLPQGLFSQFNFLQDNPLGFKSYYAFKNCFQIHREILVQNRRIQIAVGVQNEELLNHKLQQHSVRYKKVDCLKDLPAKIYEQRLIELTPEQLKLYNDLKRNAFLMLEKEPVVTAPMVITQRIKLHQIVCGFLIPDKAVDKSIIELPNNRMSALLELLEEHDGKVIIWAGYGYLIQKIHATLVKEYGPSSAAMYWGQTPNNDRPAIQKNFQDEKHPLRFFVGNPASGKFALTLTAARLVIYFANREDLEARYQSEDRCHRKGQLNSVTYIDIIVPKTVDETIHRNLIEGKTIADRILDGGSWRDWL